MREIKKRDEKTLRETSGGARGGRETAERHGCKAKRRTNGRHE